MVLPFGFALFWLNLSRYWLSFTSSRIFSLTISVADVFSNNCNQRAIFLYNFLRRSSFVVTDQMYLPICCLEFFSFFFTQFELYRAGVAFRLILLERYHENRTLVEGRSEEQLGFLSLWDLYVWRGGQGNVGDAESDWLCDCQFDALVGVDVDREGHYNCIEPFYLINQSAISLRARQMTPFSWPFRVWTSSPRSTSQSLMDWSVLQLMR